MSRIFFTSDLHFFHTNVIQFCNRPFGSVEHMNEMLIKNWNLVVKDEDHVYVLGDVSFGRVPETEQVLRQLKGIKHLITGNHDRIGRCEKLKWDNHFVEQHDYLRLKTPYGKLVLCHFPFRSWERGYINLHGHLHTLPHEYQGKWMQYDVGVDNNNYAPILLQDAIHKATHNKVKEVLY